MTSEKMLLVVEDDPVIRLAMEEALEHGGFKVAAIADGEAALALLDDPTFTTSGLITDIRMGPGPNGWDLARRAREVNPSICVVYISGDSAGQWPVEGVPKSLMIAKPFAEAQLIAAISSLLNEQSSTLPTPD